VEYFHKVWYGKIRMAWLPDGEKFANMFTRFDKIAYTNVTDIGQTDGQTPHDTIGCAYA